MRFNQPPTEEWEEAIEFITNIIIDLVNEKLYDNPKITTRHLYNGFTKEIDYNSEKRDIFSQDEVMYEPTGNLPF